MCLQNVKAAGPDRVSGEHLKFGNLTFNAILHLY